MSTPADLSRPLPTAATEAREEKLVESKGVEPLADSTPGPGEAAESGGAAEPPSAPASVRLFAALGSVDCSPPLWDLLAGIIEELGRCADLVTVQRVADHVEIASLYGELESAEADAKEFAAEIDEVAAALGRWKPLTDSVGAAMNELVLAHAAAVAELEKAKADLAKERDVSSRLASRAADTIAIDTSHHWEERAKFLEAELAKRVAVIDVSAPPEVLDGLRRRGTQDLVEQFQSAAAPNIRVEIRVAAPR